MYLWSLQNNLIRYLPRLMNRVLKVSSLIVLGLSISVQKVLTWTSDRLDNLFPEYFFYQYYSYKSDPYAPPVNLYVTSIREILWFEWVVLFSVLLWGNLRKTYLQIIIWCHPPSTTLQTILFIIGYLIWGVLKFTTILTQPK